ncbi:hypothetical protein BCV70DRAFT_201868 [Testicularia cyperi]|uniref:Uncharacterized protein n=1 Tax=Testicularia cyperi TaxID=1882483 RepID=A0A317XJS2_9BASI|nr:hypothetical protein BCV70DRAFT_201868 [Testicularia cyperi]
MRAFRSRLAIFLLVVALAASAIVAVPVGEVKRRSPSPLPTVAPRMPPSSRSTPDEVYAFYSPRDASPKVVGWDSSGYDGLERRQARQATPVSKRQDTPALPLASYGPPKFPADIPSCPKCEADYGSLSNCMGAASVFANATSIFNNPMAYINVIRCACTDTFQSVFPQCVDCFQNTDQCYYLGTDPQGTGAGNIVSNIRNICGLGSALLGGVATANTNVGSVIPSNPGSYTDVSSTGAGYKDQSTGAIFQSSAQPAFLPRLDTFALLAISATSMAVLAGAARIFY